MAYDEYLGQDLAELCLGCLRQFFGHNFLPSSFYITRWDNFKRLFYIGRCYFVTQPPYPKLYQRVMIFLYDSEERLR